jgi:hypothetical protein
MRAAIVTIAPQALVGLLKPNEGQACRILENAIPANAKLLEAWYSHDRRCFCLSIESDELPYEVVEGDMLPYLRAPVMGWVDL